MARVNSGYTEVNISSKAKIKEENRRGPTRFGVRTIVVYGICNVWRGAGTKIHRNGKRKTMDSKYKHGGMGGGIREWR